MSLSPKLGNVTAEMLRAAQLYSELGGYATSNLIGAYDLIGEMYEVMHAAKPKSELKVGCAEDLDTANIQRLAEAVITELKESGERWPQEDDWFEPELCSAQMAYVKAASPAVMLGLLSQLGDLDRRHRLLQSESAQTKYERKKTIQVLQDERANFNRLCDKLQSYRSLMTQALNRIERDWHRIDQEWGPVEGGLQGDIERGGERLIPKLRAALSVSAEPSAPVEHAQWNGEGLPPVGAVCEFSSKEDGWIQVTVLTHCIDEYPECPVAISQVGSTGPICMGAAGHYRAALELKP